MHALPVRGEGRVTKYFLFVTKNERGLGSYTSHPSEKISEKFADNIGVIVQADKQEKRKNFLVGGNY